MIKVTTEQCPDKYGYHIVAGKNSVGELRVQENVEGGRTLILDVKGVESLPETADDVREQLAARGFDLDDVSHVDEFILYVNSYGVRVYRDPDEAARFRMVFVSGKRDGEIVEIDVRADGTTVSEVPDGWMPTVFDTETDDWGVQVPVLVLLEMLHHAFVCGQSSAEAKPDAEAMQAYKSMVNDTLASLGLDWTTL